MDGRILANKLKDILTGISGWAGRVYVYIPNVKEREDFLQVLMDENRRINAWFIRRTGWRLGHYGERRTPSGYREKLHLFEIKGYLSLADQAQALASEEAFQDLCDQIEDAFAGKMSLGITDHTLVLRGIDAMIGMDSLGPVLCHTATITLEIAEWLATTYTN